MAKNKKQGKFKPILVVFVLLGGVCGFLITGLLQYLEQDGVSSLFGLIFVITISFISFFITPVIHEAGHLVMGLLTGYEFVSFRVGTFTIIRENGKFVRRKFDLAGTGGQCILTYRAVNNPQDIPYFWYNFGGVFFNFLTAFLCVPIILLVKNSFVFVGFAVFAGISVLMGIINIIPTKSLGVGTDGYNLILMKKSPADRAALYKIMVINALQYQGTRLEDMPGELLKFSDEEKKCTFGSALIILEANLLMNKHDFINAEKKYRIIAEDGDALELYRNECKCEIMFCMVMNGCTAEDIDHIYDKDLKKYIAATEKTYIMRKRLMYAYYLRIEKDPQKALKEYNLARKMEDTYPAKGEYLSEMDLIEYIRIVGNHEYEK